MTEERKYLVRLMGHYLVPGDCISTMEADLTTDLLLWARDRDKAAKIEETKARYIAWAVGGTVEAYYDHPEDGGVKIDFDNMTVELPKTKDDDSTCFVWEEILS